MSKASPDPTLRRRNFSLLTCSVIMGIALMFIISTPFTPGITKVLMWRTGTIEAIAATNSYIGTNAANTANPPTATLDPSIPTATPARLLARFSDIRGVITGTSSKEADISLAEYRMYEIRTDLPFVVRTGENGSARLAFVEGPVIHIGANTQVTLEEVIDANAIHALRPKLDYGKVWILSSSGFAVTTPWGTVSTLQTDSMLSLESTPDEKTDIVTCLEGSGKYVNSSMEQTLARRQQFVSQGNAPLVSPKPMSSTQFINWAPYAPEIITPTPTPSITPGPSPTRTPLVPIAPYPTFTRRFSTPEPTATATKP